VDLGGRVLSPPGLGIIRSRTGSGQNEPSFRAARRSSRNPGTPASCLTYDAVTPSTPEVLALLLPATRANATYRDLLRQAADEGLSSLLEPRHLTAQVESNWRLWS
jgi:hypothetical protein